LTKEGWMLPAESAAFYATRPDGTVGRADAKEQDDGQAS
jgi:hypothetical protein